MRLGDFERAWQESDCAGASCTANTLFQAKTVLIRCLRGLGDAIQFLRFAKLLAGQGRKVLVEAPAGLLPLLQFVPGVQQGFPLWDARIPEHDCAVECSDLPYLFRCTEASIPCAEGYIEIPPERVAAAAHIIGSEPERIRIGASWAGGAWNPTRSVPAHLLSRVANLHRVCMFSLQKGPECAQIESLEASNCIAAEREEEDIVYTAALILNLDLILTVDTMLAHLAGALGRPVWVLLPFHADWRWMNDRADSPWYRSMRLFRQPSRGDWRGAIDLARRELRKLSRRRGELSGSLPIFPAPFPG